jgi:ribosomal protein S18 acetylase RimI-like enzyme
VAVAGFQARTLELTDGTKVLVRPIVPEDEPLLHEAVAAMSERTVYFRFFSPLKRMPDALAHRLAVVDYNDRFALVATTNKPGGDQYGPSLPPRKRAKERILGVARYDRVAGTDVAETAVAVVDEFQRRGLGSALMTILGKVAADHGIKTFTLIVLPENQQMLGLLRKMGWIHRAKLSGGLYDISFELPAAE